MYFDKHTISIDDINLIKEIYRNGNENAEESYDIVFNYRVSKERYNTNLVSSETFFCDLRNEQLVNIVKKYITLNEKTEYISNIHYINYQIGEEAKAHVDSGVSIRTYIILLNNDFEGGDFYLKDKHIPFSIGEIIEFDANILHSVKPIIKGNREVLVIWVRQSQKSKKSIL